MKKLKKLNRDQMKVVNGGVKWTACKSTNVCDKTSWKPCFVQSAEAYAWDLIYCPELTEL